MSEQRLSTPAAIVLAGGMIAVAVFLGLRDQRRDATPAPGSDAAGNRRAATAEAPRDVGPPAPVRAPPEQVVQQIAANLALQKPAIVEKCWKPSAAATPSPKPARYTFEFSISPDGKQLARGVREERGTGSPEITRCMLEMLAPVAIAPPGANTTVEVPFTIP